MSLYAIGDLHLSFTADKPMEPFGPLWHNHVARLKENWLNTVTERDTIVLCGDHSWGRNLNEAEADLEFICSLPGNKVMLRGNHDMFWDVKKTGKLNDLYEDRLFFLQNNYAVYRDYALVGTKGYCWEGKDTFEHAETLVQRELERLRISMEKASEDGFTDFLMFLHYPPTNIIEYESGFTQLAEEYKVEQVIYAHCHGAERFHDSITGMHNGIEYSLVSGDYLGFMPKKIR